MIISNDIIFINDEKLSMTAEVIAESMLHTKSYLHIYRITNEMDRLQSMKLLFFYNLKLIIYKSKKSLYFNFDKFNNDDANNTCKLSSSCVDTVVIHDNNQILLSFFMLVSSDDVEFNLFELIYYGNMFKMIWNCGIYVIQRYFRPYSIDRLIDRVDMKRSLEGRMYGCMDVWMDR